MKGLSVNANSTSKPSRRTLSPSQIEILRDHLCAYTGMTTIYFQIIGDGSAFADYLAEVTPRSGGLFGYILGGHGIGTNTKHPVPLDSTSERLLAHNRLFHGGGSITYEFT